MWPAQSKVKPPACDRATPTADLGVSFDKQCLLTQMARGAESGGPRADDHHGRRRFRAESREGLGRADRRPHRSGCCRLCSFVIQPPSLEGFRMSAESM